MQNSKLVQCLKALSPNELGRFEKYVHSPYFHSHEGTIRLFDNLMPHYPDFDQKSVQKTELFATLFPGEPFQSQKLFDLSSYLLRLLMDFLVLEADRAQKLDWNYLTLIPELSAHGLDKFIPRLLNDAENRLEESPLREGFYYYQRFRLTEQICRHIIGQDNRTVEVELQSISNHLDYFFLLEKLKVAVQIANRQSIVAEDQSLELISEVRALYREKKLGNAPLIDLYYALLMMLVETDSQSYFEKAVEQLGQCRELMSRLSCYHVYILLCNYCTRQYKRGEGAYLSELYRLYQQMREVDILLLAGTAVSHNFKNYVTLGLKLKAYEETEKFILQNSHRLPLQTQKGLVSYNLANLYFAQGDFRKALRHLNQVEFIDPFYRLSYDLLLLKIYYECGEVESLFSRCDAFRKFIQRNNSLSPNNQQAYGNFSRFIRKLARLRFGGRGKIGSIQAALQETQNLVERNWLEEKLGELVL